jgi:hypothetical protein
MAKSNTIANRPTQLVCVKDKDPLGIKPVGTPAGETPPEEKGSLTS